MLADLVILMCSFIQRKLLSLSMGLHLLSLFVQFLPLASLEYSLLIFHRMKLSKGEIEGKETMLG